ncbi:hypothetical protein BDY19DRAFT_989841, partial [Irpex rosettiformis]
LKIVNAALGEEIADETSRSSLRLVYSGPGADDSDDEDEDEDEDSDRLAPVATVLCSLTPGKIEQATLDIILEGGQAVAFENTGKNVIYITGNFIDQVPHDDPPSEDELGIPEDDEEAFRLEDVSSDVEVEADGLADDEEEDVSMGEPEPQEQPPKANSKKRHLDEDAKEKNDLSKAEKKKQKKLKGEAGEAVPVAVEEAVQKKEKKKSKKHEKQNEEAPKGDSAKSAREVTGGVKIQDVKPGEGAEAKKGDTVRMRYIGKLDDGTVFDSNTKGKAFEFTLGDGDVIKGWDVGIVGMKKGGERVLVIPPSMGYGKRKQSGIPPSSTLTFEVTLLKIV